MNRLHGIWIILLIVSNSIAAEQFSLHRPNDWMDGHGAIDYFEILDHLIDYESVLEMIGDQYFRMNEEINHHAAIAFMKEHSQAIAVIESIAESEHLRGFSLRKRDDRVRNSILPEILMYRYRFNVYRGEHSCALEDAVRILKIGYLQFSSGNDCISLNHGAISLQRGVKLIMRQLQSQPFTNEHLSRVDDIMSQVKITRQAFLDMIRGEYEYSLMWLEEAVEEVTQEETARANIIDRAATKQLLYDLHLSAYRAVEEGAYSLPVRQLLQKCFFEMEDDERESIPNLLGILVHDGQDSALGLAVSRIDRVETLNKEIALTRALIGLLRFQGEHDRLPEDIDELNRFIPEDMKEQFRFNYSVQSKTVWICDQDQDCTQQPEDNFVIHLK